MSATRRRMVTISVGLGRLRRAADRKLPARQAAPSLMSLIRMVSFRVGGGSRRGCGGTTTTGDRLLAFDFYCVGDYGAVVVPQAERHRVLFAG